jgi:hypothetical protein
MAQTKQQRIDELEKQLEDLKYNLGIQHHMYGDPEDLVKRAEEAEAKVTDLNRQLNQTNEALRIGEVLQRINVSVWRADNMIPNVDGPECTCVSLDNGLSISIYDDGDQAIGFVVFDESKFLSAFGLIPGELLLREVEYATKYGRA